MVSLQLTAEPSSLPAAATSSSCSPEFTRNPNRLILETEVTRVNQVRKTNRLFVGPSGVGKTHISNAIGQFACLRGYKVRLVVAADLVNNLVSGQEQNTLHRKLSTWTAPDLPLIDELGYLHFDSRGADLLYRVLTNVTSEPRPSSPPTSLSKTGETSSTRGTIAAQRKQNPTPDRNAALIYDRLHFTWPLLPF